MAPQIIHPTDLGFIPIVLQDACGAGHAEAGLRSLATMRFVGEAVLTEGKDFVQLLGHSSP
jgi:nicotinamidase-related amidase